MLHWWYGGLLRRKEIIERKYGSLLHKTEVLEYNGEFELGVMAALLWVLGEGDL